LQRPGFRDFVYIKGFFFAGSRVFVYIKGFFGSITADLFVDIKGTPAAFAAL
jgi:hypothetical protein